MKGRPGSSYHGEAALLPSGLTPDGFIVRLPSESFLRELPRGASSPALPRQENCKYAVFVAAVRLAKPCFP